MPTTRKIAVSASYEAAERPKTVASQLANQPPKKALGGRNLHRRWYREIPVDRACTHESFGVQIVL